MDKKQAMECLTRCIESYRGTAQEHRILSQALKVVNDSVFKGVTDELRSGTGEGEDKDEELAPED